MGLLKGVTAEDAGIGVAMPDAYHKIMEFTGHANDLMEFIVATYASHAARTANKDPVKISRFRMTGFNHAAEVPVKSALYVYLKTLPGFSGATDD